MTEPLALLLRAVLIGAFVAWLERGFRKRRERLGNGKSV